MRVSIWFVTLALLSWASAGYAQTRSLDREVKALPGRELRVGVYTSMRAAVWPVLPPIRLSVAPEHGIVTVRRDTQSDQRQAVPGG